LEVLGAQQHGKVILINIVNIVGPTICQVNINEKMTKKINT
jgi:hypothetical protein